MNILLPGFADPEHGAQGCFRALLAAMAAPGQPHRVDAPPPAPAGLGPAAAAMLLTLVDPDTPVWTDAGAAARDWLVFHAGCPFVTDPGRAAFLHAAGSPPALSTLEPGTDADPQRGATLLVEVAAIEAAPGWRLAGPGIADRRDLRVDGLPADFLAQWAANHAGYPCGVDLILCAGDRFVALPRSITIEG